MKKQTKRNLLTFLLSTSVVCSAFAVASVAAKAEETAVTPKTLSEVALTMSEGASIRLMGETGIRFNALMSKADYASIEAYYDTLTYGAFIVPAAYNEQSSIENWENFFGANPVYDWDGTLDEGKLPAMATESLIYENDKGSMQINGSVIGIHDNHLYLDYVGVCYVKAEKAGVVEYKFATLAADQERNIVYVAQKANESGEYTAYETTLNGLITRYVDYYKTQNDGAVPTVNYTVETYYNDTKAVETKTATLNEKVTLDTNETELGGIVLKEKESTLTGTALASDKLVLKKVYTVDMTSSITMDRDEQGVLTATITGAEGAGLRVNDEVVANPYTVTVSQDTTFEYQVERDNLPGLENSFVSNLSTRYIAANALSDEVMKGRYVIEDFSNENALVNVSAKATQPLGYTHDMVDSVFSYQGTTISNLYAKAEKSLKVETKATPWVSWSAATYYFAGIDPTKYERIGMKVVFPDWANSQYGANYIGLVIDGKYTPIDHSKYAYISKEVATTTVGEQLSASKGYYLDGDVNALCAYMTIDLKAYLIDFPEIGSIDGIYFGAYKTKTAYIDEIYVGDAPDALDWDFSRPNDVDAQVVYVVSSGCSNSGIVADEGANDGYALKLSWPASTWKDVWVYLGGVTLADYESITVRMRANKATHCYLRGPNDTSISGKYEFIPSTYVEWDIMKAVSGTTDTTQLSYLKFQNGAASAELYIDSITFVKKA